MSYGPLYLSLVVVDENAFCLTLRIPVFPLTATQCCMDSDFYAFIAKSNKVSFSVKYITAAQFHPVTPKLDVMALEQSNNNLIALDIHVL